jgi:hypothetical protein
LDAAAFAKQNEFQEAVHRSLGESLSDERPHRPTGRAFLLH